MNAAFLSITGSIGVSMVTRLIPFTSLAIVLSSALSACVFSFAISSICFL